MVHHRNTEHSLQPQTVAPASEKGRFYMHYRCFTAYSASYKSRTPSELEISKVFLEYCQGNRLLRWEIWNKHLSASEISKAKFFIKTIPPTEKRTDQFASDEIAVECYTCVDSYFKDWIAQGANPYNFIINVHMISDEDVADRREYFYGPQYPDLEDIPPSPAKKRDAKYMRRSREDSEMSDLRLDNDSFWDDESEDSDYDDNSSYRSSKKRVALKADGRPMRTIK